MDFSLDSWKKQSGQRFQRLTERLQELKNSGVPYTVYSFLAAMSLWPLVEAAQAGQMLPVAVALGSVAGGVGGNLVAEQIQRWVDRGGEPTETNIEADIAQDAPTNPELREALDTILEKLEAIPQAQAGLNEADRQWFGQTLRQELSELGSLDRFSAVLEGTIIQGSDLQGGDQSVVGSQAQRDMVTGEGHAITNIEGDYLDQRRVMTEPNRASLRLEIKEKEFCHSFPGLPPAFAKECKPSAYGFDEDGLPCWASLRVRFNVVNTGGERGELIWEIDPESTNLPDLFTLDEDKRERGRIVRPFPAGKFAPRDECSVEWRLFVEITEQYQDPNLFASALRLLDTYEVGLRYWTKDIDGISSNRYLPIRGNFQGYREKIIELWKYDGFNELAQLAQSDEFE